MELGDFENIINNAIRVSIINNILNIYSGTGSSRPRTIRNPNRISPEIHTGIGRTSVAISSRYYNNPPQGGYLVDEEHEYIFPDADDLASLVFLDVATRFGSPGSEMKDYRMNDVLLNNQCPICIENFCCGEYQRTLNCSHSFHKKCIDKWFKKDKNDCPMCRAKIIED